MSVEFKTLSMESSLSSANRQAIPRDRFLDILRGLLGSKQVVKAGHCYEWYRRQILKTGRFIIIYEFLLGLFFAAGCLKHYFVFTIHWWLLLNCAVIIAALGPLLYGRLCRKAEAVCQDIGKMSMLANIASGVGHNLNNRFNSLLTLINLYYLKYNNHEDIKGLPVKELETRYSELLFLLKEMKKETTLGFSIAESVSKFAGQPFKPEAFYLENAVFSAFTLLSYKKDFSRIKVVKHYSNSGPQLWASLANIQDVLFQLGDNAYDAVLEKECRIKSGNVHSALFKPTIIIYADLRKHGVMISISDNGIGMDKAVLDKIGRPFFSTKNGRNGHLGMGLWLVKRHLAINSSNLTVHSKYGEGANFSFFLPYAK